MNIHLTSARLHNDITTVNAVCAGLSVVISTLRDSCRLVFRDESGLSISVQGPRGEAIKRAADLLCFHRPSLRLPAVVEALERVAP